MKTLPSLVIAISLPFLPSAKANYVYHWIPEPSTIGPTSGSIEITDSAYLAGSFSLAGILDFKFVEPPFFLSPAVYGQTTWDVATTGAGTLTGDKPFVLHPRINPDAVNQEPPAVGFDGPVTVVEFDQFYDVALVQSVRELIRAPVRDREHISWFRLYDAAEHPEGDVRMIWRGWQGGEKNKL